MGNRDEQEDQEEQVEQWEREEQAMYYTLEDQAQS